MKNLKFFFLLLMIFFTASCTKDLLFDTPDQTPDDANSLKCASTKFKIAVVSDIHYMNPSLLPDDVANNPEALSFKGETPSPVSSVTTQKFASLYGGFGYGDAIYRDQNSLSYIP